MNPESQLNPDSVDLKPVQAKVIAALASGQSVSAAARTAGVHRSTVHAWLNEPGFRSEYDRIRRQNTQSFQGDIIELERLALETIGALMQDPDASPSVRLRAALAILNRAALMHAAGTQEPPEPAESATARNAPCPCGSGQKYKRCCGRSAPPVLAVRHSPPATNSPLAASELPCAS